MNEAMGEVDPAKYAGEGFGNIDEYARPGDIESPWVRGDMLDEEGYYPRADWENRMRRY